MHYSKRVWCLQKCKHINLQNTQAKKTVFLSVIELKAKVIALDAKAKFFWP